MIAQPKDQLRSLFSKLAANKFWLIISLILIIYGQSIIQESQPLHHLGKLSALFSHWNNQFYWSLNNPVNVIAGLLFIIAGTFVSVWVFRCQPVSELAGEKQQGIFWEFSIETLKGISSRSTHWIIICLLAYIAVIIQLSQHHSTLFATWLFGLSLLIPTIVLFGMERKKLVVASTQFSYRDGAIAFLLFALAIFVGSYLLTDVPAGWTQDEGPFWTMARKLALGQETPSFFDFGVFTFPVASSYLQGWILHWFGVNFWGWRFSSVLSAAMTVFPLYFLSKTLFDRRTAIAACILMIANPYFLLFARLGYNNSQALFPVTLCIYFFSLALQRRSLYYFWLAGLTAGLGFYTYFAAWLGLVVIFILILSTFLFSSRKLRQSTSILLVIITGAVIIMLPRFVYGFSGKEPIRMHFKIWETGAINTFYAKQVFGDERINRTKTIKINEAIDIYYDPGLYGLTILRGTVRTMAALFDPLDYADHPISYGLGGPGSSIFLMLGIGICLANLKRIIFLIPFTWFLTGFVILGVCASLPPRPTHMVTIIPAMALISSIGLMNFIDLIINNPESPSTKQFSFKHIANAGILFLISVSGLVYFFYLSPYFYYPPNQDDYVSWLGRQLPPNSRLILIDHLSTTRNPVDEKLLKLSELPLLITTRKNLDTNPKQIKYWENFAAFIDWQDGKEYAKGIADQIPNSTIQVAYAPGRRFRGYVISDLHIDADMHINYLNGIIELWKSPARWVLLFCMMTIIGFIFLDNRAHQQSF